MSQPFRMPVAGDIKQNLRRIFFETPCICHDIMIKYDVMIKHDVMRNEGMTYDIMTYDVLKYGVKTTECMTYHNMT